MQIAPRRQFELAAARRGSPRTGASTPVRLIGAWARVLNGSSNNSRCAVAPSAAVAVMPAIAGSVSSVDGGDDFLDLAPGFRRKQRGKTVVLHVVAEQGADAACQRRERDSRPGSVVGQHEDVAEQFAHRAGLDLAAVGRACFAALVCPNRRRIRGSTDVSYCNLTPRAIAVRHFCPAFAHAHSRLVLQDGHCSVHATRLCLAFWPRLCGVNVKLTMGLATRDRPASVRLPDPSPGLLQVPAGHTGGVKQFGRLARGGVGSLPPGAPRDKRPAPEGGLSQSPPFDVMATEIADVSEDIV